MGQCAGYADFHTQSEAKAMTAPCHPKLRAHVVRELLPRASECHNLTDRLGLAPDLCLSCR